VHTYNVDRAMRLAGNPNPDSYYEPNSFNGPMQDERFREPPLKISGDADRYSHGDGNDDYRQAGDLFRLMTASQKEQLFQNYKAAMERVPVEIVKRQIVHCYRADPEYGLGIAKAIGIDFTPRMVAAE
jgi:catalase